MMRWLEAVDAEDLFAGAGKMIKGRASVGPQTYNDDIERFGGVQLWDVTMLFGSHFHSLFFRQGPKGLPPGMRSSLVRILYLPIVS